MSTTRQHYPTPFLEIRALTRCGSESTGKGDLLLARLFRSLSPLVDACALDEPEPSTLTVSSDPRSSKDRFSGAFVGVRVPLPLPETRGGLVGPSMQRKDPARHHQS